MVVESGMYVVMIALKVIWLVVLRVCSERYDIYGRYGM